MTKEIHGINVFDSREHAEKCRKKALLAESKLPHARRIALYGGVAVWAIMLIRWITGFEAIILAAYVIAVISYVKAEKYAGKWCVRYLLKWALGGHGAAFFLFFYFEIVLTFAIIVMVYALFLFYGFGFALLYIDQYFIRAVIDATADFGFDDTYAMEEGRRLAGKAEEDEAVFKANAEDFVSQKVGAVKKRAKSSIPESRTAQGSAKIWYCPSCRNRNTGKFCSSCGEARPAENTEAQEEEFWDD